MFTKKKTLPETLRGQVGDLAGKVTPHVENAIDQIGPILADAREKTAPYVADARDKAGPVLVDARDRFVAEVVPAVSAAVAAAGEKAADLSAPARKEVKRRGRAAAAAVRGEVDPPKKGSKLRKLLVFGGLAGIGAFLFNRFRGGKESTPWQSSYAPPAPAAPTAGPSPAHKAPAGPAAAATPDDTADPAGSGPDEALADAAAEQRPATTPDSPVEEIDLSDEADPKP